MEIKGAQSIANVVEKCEIPVHCRPFLLFQGDAWESDDTYKRLRNLFNDFFFENNKISGIEATKILRVLISFTLTEN